jgi:hypothetical protein
MGSAPWPDAAQRLPCQGDGGGLHPEGVLGTLAGPDPVQVRGLLAEHGDRRGMVEEGVGTPHTHARPRSARESLPGRMDPNRPAT